ncbi:hypothetical protein [Sphingobacterium sp. MYb388]|uniref:hypothetical protein n=1 Tax=Sphingobacterium sp. MYb388 TaxID=2745437 RepID=UPI00309C5B48
MNDFYRTLLNNSIKKALADADTASKINHPYLIGKLRELFIDSLLQPKKYIVHLLGQTNCSNFAPRRLFLSHRIKENV